MMKDNQLISHQKDYGLRDLEGTGDNLDNAATPADVAPYSAVTRVPIDPYGLSAEVPVIEDSGHTLTTFLGAAEKLPHVPHPRTAWECTPPASLMCYDYSSDAHLRPWPSTAETEHTNPCTPQAYWEQSSSTGMQPNRSEVPSDASILRGSWLHRAGDYHAVGALTQPDFHLERDYLSRTATLSCMPTSIHSSTSQVPTGFDGVRSWMAQSLLEQVPSLSHHRRRFRKSHPYPERVICDKCQKTMRPQSLKRHMKEVHDRIRRHVKSGFRGGPYFQTGD